MKVTENNEVTEAILAFGGFGDVRLGTYNGSPVAVKTMRVAALDSFLKIRKVSIDVDHLGCGLNHPSRPSDFTGRLFSGKDYPIRTF